MTENKSAGMMIIKHKTSNKTSKLKDIIASSSLYSEKGKKWNYSFSPSIFMSSNIPIVLSDQVYENYKNLLEISKKESVCEFPFIWIGQKFNINDQPVIKIFYNIPYPILNIESIPNDLDSKSIIDFLNKQYKSTEINTEILKNETISIPPINMAYVENASSPSGITGSEMYNFLNNFKTLENLVICAGHTHPLMTENSKNSVSQIFPKGESPKTFGLGELGTNFSSADLEVWLSSISHECFDQTTTFIGTNICHDGNLHMVIYEKDEPTIARKIYTESDLTEIKTSTFNEEARNNFLKYIGKLSSFGE